jgi:hypothetical protein
MPMLPNLLFPLLLLPLHICQLLFAPQSLVTLLLELLLLLLGLLLLLLVLLYWCIQAKLGSCLRCLSTQLFG